MNFEEFKARYEKHLKSEAFKGTNLPVSDEDLIKLYIALVVLKEYRTEKLIEDAKDFKLYMSNSRKVR